MAFIPHNPTVGTRVKLNRDVTVLSGTFKAGKEMTITGSGPRGLDFVDDDGNMLCETGFLGNFFTKIR